jgi:hypothetical protein
MYAADYPDMGTAGYETHEWCMQPGDYLLFAYDDNQNTSAINKSKGWDGGVVYLLTPDDGCILARARAQYVDKYGSDKVRHGATAGQGQILRLAWGPHSFKCATPPHPLPPSPTLSHPLPSRQLNSFNIPLWKEQNRDLTASFRVKPEGAECGFEAAADTPFRSGTLDMDDADFGFCLFDESALMYCAQQTKARQDSLTLEYIPACSNAQ